MSIVTSQSVLDNIVFNANSIHIIEDLAVTEIKVVCSIASSSIALWNIAFEKHDV